MWERLLVISFVEEASASGLFVLLRLLVNQVEGADFATKMMIGVVPATEGHSRR
jgi:hypothetical protein